MEPKFGGNTHNLYAPVMPDLEAVGKKSMEWDLNDWRWDGDMFTAASLNPVAVPSDSRNKQLFPVGSEIPSTVGLLNDSLSCSDKINLVTERGKTDLEKRRRVVVVEDEELNDGPLDLMIGGRVYPITEGESERCNEKSGKKPKVVGATTNRTVCQVEGCGSDLSNGKDYHRRHKVCEMHSKASQAVVGNVLQRFCQQCSRFHVLQEFDEGKRSCRRRLAGHNRRRRKTHPENASNGASANDDQGSNYLLASLLRILSSINASNLDQTKDQDLVAHLLRNLANLSGAISQGNASGLLPGCQDLQNAGPSIVNPKKGHLKPDGQHMTAAPASNAAHRRKTEDVVKGVAEQALLSSYSAIPFSIQQSASVKANPPLTKTGSIKLNNFDLNSVYDDSQDLVENFRGSMAPVNMCGGSLGCPLWIQQDCHKSSPPQTSTNSGSTATMSPSTSSGDAQSCTDRIVFKLFGKDPGDFPLVLRKQILDWLSHSPTEIESYIRPGCIILTIYLRMEKAAWEELCSELRSTLRQLLNASRDSFWRSGWVYARVCHRLAFVYNGQVVLDTSLPLKSCKTRKILSVKPIAVATSERVQFTVVGFNLCQSTTRLLCGLGGKYLVLKSCSDLMEGSNPSTSTEGIQSLSFSCSIPNVSERGFIEVEDHSLSSSFFPFIVAEKDVCAEIRTLECDMEVTATDHNLPEESERVEVRNQALDFINEMGWLLHRNHLKFRLGRQDPTADLFSFVRFRWLMEFSLDHGWCAVVLKLLDIIFGGSVDSGEHASIELALVEIGPLHRAVLRNCRPLVEVLLRYHKGEVLETSKSGKKQLTEETCYLFKPDVVGPGGFTPLHIAANGDGYENVLDALTDDPGLVGIEAWRTACDDTGKTPNDYAFLRERYTYMNLVQKKINKKLGSGHVVLDIHGVLLDCNMKQKLAIGHKSAKVASFQMEKTVVKPLHGCCQICEQKLAYGNVRTSLAIYRPAMLSMVAIAAVCVCVALLFKSSPEVRYVFRPFRWELLKFGPS